jgi:hypothetical protein
MSRRFRLLAALILVTSVGLVLPPDSAAQRRPPSGAVARHGTAVPRTYHSGGYYRPGGAYYRPYYYRPYYYRPYYYRPYYYSRYSYPYYPYYYAPFYYPSYYGFGFGFGWGSLGFSYGYGYPYSYPYPSGYAAPYAYAQPYAGAPSGYGAPGSVQMQQPAPAPQDATAESGSFGTLSMRVTPPDSTILIDGQVWDRPQGQDRFSIDLVEGTHRVEVRQQGYTPYTRTVQIRGGGTLTLNVSLPSGGGGNQVQQLAVRRTVPLR